MSNGNQPNLFAEVESLFEDRKGRAHVNLQWLYKPEEVMDGRLPHHGEFELFRSKHIDPNPVEIMLGHVNVLCEGEYQKYIEDRKKQQEAKNDGDQQKEEQGEDGRKKRREPPVYFVKRFYNHCQGTFAVCEWGSVAAENIIDDLPSDDGEDGDEEQKSYGGQGDRKDVGDYQSATSEEADEEEKEAIALGDEKRAKRKREPTKASAKETRKEAVKKLKSKQSSPTTSSREPKKRGRPRKKRPAEEPEQEGAEPERPVGKRAAKNNPPTRQRKRKKVSPTSSAASRPDGAELKTELSINERLTTLAGEPNQSALVKQLLAAGANPRFIANPSTSLQQCSIHYAAAFGRADTLRVLLDHDNTLTGVVTLRGWSPLHYAAHKKHLDAVRVLLQYLADPLLKTTDGRSALDIAKSKDSNDVVEALMHASETDELVIEVTG